MMLVRSMLLEKKIIFIKNDTSDVAVIIQILITLAQPFRWPYIIVTNLPESMVDTLECPQPFIIGIERRLWDSKCSIQHMDNRV